MTRDEAINYFHQQPAERVGKAFDAAVRRVKAASTLEYVERNTGVYNCVAVPEIPARIVSVRDGNKDPDVPAAEVKLVIGQQVVFHRNLVPPVTVRYVSVADQALFDGELLAAVEAELEAANRG